MNQYASPSIIKTLKDLFVWSGLLVFVKNISGHYLPDLFLRYDLLVPVLLSKLRLAKHSKVNLAIPECLAVKLTLESSALKQDIAVIFVARIEACCNLSQQFDLLVAQAALNHLVPGKVAIQNCQILVLNRR